MANHFQMRNAAERRKAELRAKKQAKKDRDLQRIAVAAEAFSREETPVVSQILKNMGDRFGQTKVPELAEPLLQELSRRKARFLIPDYTDALLNLLRLGKWVRPIEDWTPRGKGRESQFKSLVEHLVCGYTVPPFLFQVLDLPPRNEQTQQWLNFFSGVARGGSAHKLSQKYLTLPLTKKMSHLFMQTTGSKSMLFNLRWVQIKTFVQDDLTWARRLHAALMGTRAGREMADRNSEIFWESVFRWFSNQPMLDPNQVGPLVDFIIHCREENGEWSIKGRAPGALIREMDRWHGVLHQLQRISGTQFTSSGFQPCKWRVERRDQKGEYWVYTVTEILTSKDLGQEGRALKHCVYSYGRSIESGRCSIWSLRQHSAFKQEYLDEETEMMKTRWVEVGDASTADRLVTIEVINRDHRVVQVRGKYNKMPTRNQNSWIHKWVGKNGLRF